MKSQYFLASFILMVVMDNNMIECYFTVYPLGPWSFAKKRLARRIQYLTNIMLINDRAAHYGLHIV